MSKPTSCAEALLQELCVGLGYCLDDHVAERLLADPPDDPDQFTDAVLIGEGLDPALIDKQARQQVRSVVVEWLFDDGVGRGSQSGLPRFP